MKILSITPTYYPEVGGIESVVRELAMRICANGTQVDVAHVSPKHAAFSLHRMDGLDVYCIPVTAIGSWTMRAVSANSRQDMTCCMCTIPN